MECMETVSKSSIVILMMNYVNMTAKGQPTWWETLTSFGNDKEKGLYIQDNERDDKTDEMFKTRLKIRKLKTCQWASLFSVNF